MALIKCPECNKEVSDKAEVCIHCGHPLNAIIQNKTISQPLYCIKLKSFKSGGDKYFHGFLPLLRQFPEAYEKFPFGGDAYTIGTGLTKENAEWFQWEFRKVRAETEIEIDKNCTELNEKLNNFAAEGIEGVLRCPVCWSKAITTGARGASWTRGFIGASKTVNRCGKCGYTWRP